MELETRIGLIAGEGNFPLLFAKEAFKNNKEIVVIALKGEMNQDLTPYTKSVHTVSAAKLNSIIQTLKKEKIKQVVMAGRVLYTRLFTDLFPDFRATQLLFKIKDRRPDSILKAVAEEMRQEGIHLCPSTTFLGHLLPNKGLLTQRKLSKSEEKEIQFGVTIAQTLSGIDVGQTVVIKDHAVLALEAAEGTDACIRRAGKLGGENAIIVKSAKPNQDMRFDVPIVGLNTLKVMTEIGSKVLAIQADKTLMLEKETLLKNANEQGLSIYAWKKQ